MDELPSTFDGPSPLSSAAVPGPHCPRCDGKMWHTDATGATQEFTECASCGWQQGDPSPPPPLSVEQMEGPYYPTRLETFVLKYIECLAIRKENPPLAEVVKVASCLLDEIDAIELSRAAATRHNQDQP